MFQVKKGWYATVIGMQGKGEKVQERSITAYLDSDREGHFHMEQQQEQEVEEAAPLRAIRGIIIQEFGKIEAEFKQFKDMCKALEVVECSVDSKLTNIALETGQRESNHRIETLRSQVAPVENKTAKLDSHAC